MKLYRLTLIASLLSLASFGACAGYAQLAPPPGITSVGGVSTIPVGTAANGARYVGGHVVANASLQVGARAVTVPVAYRVAANAATFAVTRMNPWIAGATLAASAVPYVLDWFSAGGSPLTVNNGIIIYPAVPGGGLDLDRTILIDGSTLRQAVNAAGGQASFIQPVSYLVGYASGCPQINKPGGGFDKPAIHLRDGLANIQRTWCTGGNAPVNNDGTPARSPSADDFAPLGGAPLNPALFPALDLPVPIDPAPVINPATQPSGNVVIGPNGNPAPQLQPSTLRVPDGAPVPNPNTSPQTYTQPWLEIVPSPTPESPYRVDVRPVTTVVNSPTTPTDPVVNPGTPATPAEPGLCQKYPNIMACQPEGDFSDSGLPPVPQLYVRKYPDGLVGIWEQKKQAMRETAVAQLASQIMPTGIGDGGCPQWQIPLDVGFWNYGTVPIGIPCEYWGVLRVIMIIGSLFLARALIFGG